jgi:hypothetical protein
MAKDSLGFETVQAEERIWGIGGCPRIYDSWSEDCLACGDYQKCLEAILSNPKILQIKNVSKY